MNKIFISLINPQCQELCDDDDHDHDDDDDDDDHRAIPDCGSN